MLSLPVVSLVCFVPEVLDFSFSSSSSSAKKGDRLVCPFGSNPPFVPGHDVLPRNSSTYLLLSDSCQYIRLSVGSVE